MKTCLLSFFVLLISPCGLCQTPAVNLFNPSFEGEPGASKLPAGWFDSGFQNETPSDVQPGFFGCHIKPLHGNTYVGLVTRDNNTWERIGQKLSKELLRDTLYRFSACLSGSATYFSISRRSGMEADYIVPVRLRIWGGNLELNKEVLLAESPIVRNRDWIRYEFDIKPEHFDVNQIVLEAYYQNPERPVNGNLLIDLCSAFVPANGQFAGWKPDPVETGVIMLFNPSFEEVTGRYDLPNGWEGSNALKSRYYVHPAGKLGAFSSEPGKEHIIVTDDAPTSRDAADQDRFASLIASADGKTQSMAQQLEGVLKKDSVYSFSLFLAHSQRFAEKIEKDRLLDYKGALKLRIWSSDMENRKLELLAETPLIANKKWEKYNLTLKPEKQDCTRIMLEAGHKSDNGPYYNGNLLIDNCSAIVKQ